MKLLYGKLIETIGNFSIVDDYFDEYPEPVRRVYTKEGILVGNEQNMKKVYEAVDYAERSDSDMVACNIGFCIKENSWYGWTYSNMESFTIGSKVALGDVAFVPSNKDELLKCLKIWYASDKYIDPEIKEKRNKIIVECYERDPKTKQLRKRKNIIVLKDQIFGHGAWEAKTIDDARKMAIDYAKNVR